MKKNTSIIKLFRSTYTKRNPFVNALLSLFLLGTIYMSAIALLLLLSIMPIMLTHSETKASEWFFRITGVFYSFYCIYYMCKFIIANRKDAIISAFMGSTLVWMPIMLIILVITISENQFVDDEWKASSEYILFPIALILSIVFNAIAFGCLYLIMKIKKYGASAWSLLDASRGGKSKFDKISLWVFSLIWILPVGGIIRDEYKLNHPEDKFPSHSTAKIGDFYYEDGTVSPEFLSDKKAVGIVFSLETSETDRIRGYKHGQIVSLTDISPSKMQWSQDKTDYERYPNYTWVNRLDALNDINGLGYTNCEEFTCPTINWKSIKYMEGEIEGTSDWYVPTAGQWTKILENLGNVKVDRMLKFDAKIASNNLKEIGINPQRWYWTITEFDAENAWSIRVASGAFGSRSNKQNAAYVRPVASF